jgi:hypothetical protein
MIDAAVEPGSHGAEESAAIYIRMR